MVALRAWTCRLGSVMAAMVLLSACAKVVTGTPTWPGERLEKALLTAGDFPPGTGYGRIMEEPVQRGGAGGPSPMLSIPQGCSNGLTDVIVQSAERGRGSAAKYNVQYAGARIVMTVSTWQLNIDQLEATASRCEHFKAYFDRASEGIPISTTKLAGARPGQLLYQQTMQLHGLSSSVFMSFENFDRMAVFGMAFPATELEPGAAAMPRAALPQTFIDVVNKQGDKVRAS